MRTKSIYFAMIGFVVACLCTSCGDYWPADNVLVGKWSSLSDEIDTIRTYREAHFKTQNRLYICEEQHRNEGVGQEKKYFHYYRRYNGTYSITNDKLALHYSEITDQLVVLQNGKEIENTLTNLPVFDELVNYEVDDSHDYLTLIRYSGTDSTRTQVFVRQKFK